MQLGLTALCGLCLVVSFAAQIPGVRGVSVIGWAWAATAFGSYFAVKTAIETVRSRQVDVNLLMVLAAVGAAAVGHIEDAAVLLFLFSLSSTLESLAMARTQSAIEALVQLRPETAIRVTRDGDETVQVEALNLNDTVRVLPFEAVPTDGVLITEFASLNEAAMTGESRPVERSAGEPVLAGTQNLEQMLLLRVTATVENSSLARIVTLVREAQDNKASGERISVWFGQRYTYFVVIAFLISLLVRLTLQTPLPDALYAALVLLVALSPCALVISSPAAALSALAFAARNGVLVRGGQYLEVAGQITTVAMDKTGTLTRGRPQVVEICVGVGKVLASACGPRCDACECIRCWHLEDRLHEDARRTLRFAASAERFSTHPIAEAILALAEREGVEVPEALSHQSHPGLGIEAEVEGRTVRVGQLRFFDSETLPGGFREHVENMRAQGLTAVLVHTGEEWGAIGLRDELRPEAKALIRELRVAGVRRIAMLTGDNPGTAHSVAADLGIEEVHAGLMPDEKQKWIAEQVARGEKVVMVGDGVNDAPALTASHLGIAMGGLGSEVALRSADVVLVQDRIERLPSLLRLGRKTNRIIRANLLFAAGVIACLTVASFVTTLPLPIAVLGHEGSTVLVILNGLRLLRGP